MKKKRYKTRWSEGALADVQNIIEYIARDSIARATTINNRIFEAADTLCEHPYRGRVLPELRDLVISEFREIIVKPYRVVYRREKSSFLIVAVIDGRRNIREHLFDIMMRT